MDFDERAQLARVKQRQMIKYISLSRAARGKGNRKRAARRAAVYRNQAMNISRRHRLGPFVRKMQRELLRRMKSSVIPIFRENHHAMESGGTGTLFEIGGEFFLITAEHVVGVHEAGLGLYVPGADGHLFQLEGSDCWKRALDVAAIRLSELSVDALTGYTFLTLAEALLKRLPLQDSLFMVYGFPKENSFASVVEATIRAGDLCIVSRIFAGNPPIVRDPEVFLLLDAYANERDLNGISGCSVWQAFLTGDSFEARDSVSLKMVAVETGTYREHTIIEGTRVRHVFRMIAQHFEQLRSHIETHL